MQVLELDPLHATIALGPLAIYLAMLGLINISERPFVTSGIRDLASLGVALSGFIVVGPIELFFPDAPLATPVWLVWSLLLLFYTLCLTLIVLLQRPRIVIYNVTPEQLRPVFAEVIRQLDKEARMAGESVFLPNLGVQLHVEPMPMLKNIQLKASGPDQSYQGWMELEKSLKVALRASRGSRNPCSAAFLTFGLAMFVLIGWWMTARSEAVVHSWNTMIHANDAE